MPLAVPDASVILKWVLPPDSEEYVEQALALRNDIVLKGIAVSVPPLWYCEVGNTLARRFPGHAAEYLRELRNFGLPESNPGQPVEDSDPAAHSRLRRYLLRCGLPRPGRRPHGRIRQRR